MTLEQEAVNRATFDSPHVLDAYTDGWTDVGERKAIGYAASRVAGRPILDLGVGIGRTTVFLTRQIGTEYTGIDRSAYGIESCRARFPTLDFALCDVRDLGSYGDASFGLVHFSYNGIDLMDHAERATVLAEMTRVVADDGLVVFSTFNLDSAYAHAVPWRVDAEGEALRWRPDRIVPWIRSAPSQLGRYGRTWRSWNRLRAAGVEGDGWAIRPLRIHEFGALAHFCSLTELRRELASHGLDVERIYTTHGDEIPADQQHTDAPYTHVCASKRRPV